MKRLCTLILAAGMLLGAASGASAIDFKAKGQWLMGFGVGDTTLINKNRAPAAANKQKYNNEDMFQARQRVRLQLDAVASEALSGTVFFEIGNQKWGYANQGGALGADGNSVIKIKRAYIDWMVPQTDLKFRMGIQGVTLPNKAGGSAVFDTDVAGITASYQFNENVGLTALWMRPFNDNYEKNYAGSSKYYQNYLDNMDLFALMLPVTLDGFEITPWAMYGMRGKNTGKFADYANNDLSDGYPNFTLAPYSGNRNGNNLLLNSGRTGKAYGSMFWAGLPFAITAWDPLNIEVDLNYGYVEAMGRYDAPRDGGAWSKRSSTERSGWLAKALVEYKLDWGVPGIFGWYASGDDGNPRNGSERMPSIDPYGNFTSFMGDGNYGWGPGSGYVDKGVSYAGTWGIGLRVKDVSFLEDLKHSLTVAYWGGTNSPSEIKYMDTAYAWNYGTDYSDGPYLTTEDSLLEFNLINAWQIYENLEMNLELGYIVNCIDNDAWKKAGARDSSFEKQDAWKAQLIFAYSF
ncbi:outer membrane homotrimeric porin [Desulfovibrio sp. ZJ369]|uniref:outer membrane homotrimeric porin n=1 Tax=Desulfovibrio sp. ZJ369 TaxID=2709793 RepID=UPI0013E9C611|nr:outer membrane homotrimeric porin [Desulfovibrio sp. ZJ369]